MRTVAYALVRSPDPDVRHETYALEANGAKRVYMDDANAGPAQPNLAACIDGLGAGDLLLVYSLDRLGRSLRDVFVTVEQLKARGVALRSLTEPIDTVRVGGELFFDLCAALSSVGSRFATRRSQPGLSAARSRGRTGGRPTVMTPERISIARRMRREGATWQAIADHLGVGASSVRRSAGFLD
ncbi:recombinase family protein [Leifsonia sp. RAF41]|uniref:recombinase family protein n=1 Tax=Leifsonia sp. RAF41 TaxID=3233056 RepID=UPI003F9B37D1